MKLKGLTIDARSTRDCDDAIWAERTDDGVVLTVCIADVAKAIPKDHEFDEKARAALETRYWAGGNTPMVPRELSDDKCSLLPNRTRRVIYVRVTLDSALNVVANEVGAGKLKSTAKLAYEDIPVIVQDDQHPGQKVIKLLKEVALGLLEKRRLSGALAFYDLNEGWTSTEEGHLLRIERAQAFIGQIIVQEMMILANTTFAKHCAENEIPVPFRNHTARSIAPERDELLRQLDQARLDPSTVGALRARIHTVMNRATYDGVVIGHYGLALPYYLHGTSPIRRYADLIFQRQLRAHIKGEDLPYTADEVVAIATDITTRLREKLEAKGEMMKENRTERAERQAQQVGAQRLATMKPKDFERVLKTVLRSDEYNEEVAQAVRYKIEDDTLPVLDMFFILMQSSAAWLKVREQVVMYLIARPNNAMSVIAVGGSILGWDAPRFDVERSGPPHAPRFTLTARHTHEGVTTEGMEVTATSLKRARGQAMVSLLAVLAGVNPPVWPKLAPPTAKKAKAPIVTTNAIAALMEHSQKHKNAPPQFAFTRAGGADHTPQFTCTCDYLGKTATSPPNGNKKAAKTAAAQGVRGQL